MRSRGPIGYTTRRESDRGEDKQTERQTERQTQMNKERETSQSDERTEGLKRGRNRIRRGVGPMSVTISLIQQSWTSISETLSFSKDKRSEMDNFTCIRPPWVILNLLLTQTRRLAIPSSE